MESLGGRGGMFGPAACTGDADPGTVQGTSFSASEAVFSAVQHGYLDDPYVQYFVKAGTLPSATPVMNRGTYIRVKALNAIVENFLEGASSKVKQIVSLGAGFDTRYFYIKQKRPDIKYFEVDYKEVVRKKIKIISSESKLSNLIGSFKTDTGTSLKGYDYALLSGDLNNFEYEVYPKLLRAGLVPSMDTLYIFECVLIYLEKKIQYEILRKLADVSDRALVLIYECFCDPDDSFGSALIRDFKAMKLISQKEDVCTSINEQKTRLSNCNWSNVSALSMIEAWEKFIPEEVRERIYKLEVIGEQEEWEMLMGHYGIFWGAAARSGCFLENFSIDSIINNAKARITLP